MCITLGLELMTSCIASCVLYHQATIVQSLVLRMVCTRYLHIRQDTLDLWYLLAGVGRPARVPPRPRLWPWCHWSRHQLWCPWCPLACWLQNRALKLPCCDGQQPYLETVLESSPLPLLWRASCGSAALGFSESARLGSHGGAVWFIRILARDCWETTRLIVRLKKYFSNFFSNFFDKILEKYLD